MKGRSLVWLAAMAGIMAVNLSVWGWGAGGGRFAYAAARVSSYEELKEELGSSGKRVIYLTASISVRDTIYVKGIKELVGDGHSLRRFHMGTEVYGGTLLNVSGGELILREITIAGEGDREGVSRKTFGRLLDIGNGGRVVLEERAHLTKNHNGKENNDGGGAVRIQNGGHLVMAHGKISENQNVYGGAGVHIDAGGCFVMEGGMISDNQSYGIGGIEGFDGRGGAIFNQGKAAISGGSICHNRVKGFTGSSIVYGGVGGMLYNQGECQIQGGMISENGASYGGGAVYSDKGSKLRITGGTIRRNDASVGEGLFLAGGNCRLGGMISLPSVYLAKGVFITAEDSMSSECRITLRPALVREDICVVRSHNKKVMRGKIFSLQGSKKDHTLIFRKNGLYIVKKEKNKKSKKAEEKRVIEKTDRHVIKKPSDETKKRSRTEDPGIVVETSPRYLFVWEVASYTEEKWRDVLLKGCRIDYGGRKKDTSIFHWRWNGLLQNTAGSYQVGVSAEGNDWTIIPVTLVQESTEEKKAGYVRFQPPDTEDTTCVENKDSGIEIWHFEPQDIENVKSFMRERSNPFSLETNQEFLNRFCVCRVNKGEWEVR